MAGERQPDWSLANGVVVHALSGLYRVATAGGVLLCRPRGRLRGKAGGWRDERDAERALAVQDLPDEGEDGEAAAEPLEDTTAGEGGGRTAERRTGAAAGRGRGPGAVRTPVRDEEDATVPAVMAGDRVRCSDLGGGEGVIDEVLPRRAHLIRPPVANPDRVVVVVAWGAPPLSPAFVDRVVLQAALHGCEAAICLNKGDLLGQGEIRQARAALAPMEAAGYPVLFTSALRGDGIQELRALLQGQLAVLAGPSGSGKSRLLSALVPDSVLRSGAVSERVGRGRHTTRAVELLALPGGTAWVADTPGFSRLDLREVEVEELPGLYPEFRTCQDACRFRGCLHDTEPECAVRAAVESGRIDPDRYDRYRLILAELRARAPRW